MSSADRRLAAAASVLVFVTCAYFFGGGGWNQNAQFALTSAIVEQQTFAIDAYRAGTGDVSYANGRVYANKAPGVSFMAAVPYAALVAIERPAGIDLHEPTVVTFNAWLCTVLVCGGSAALITVMLLLAARRYGVPPGRAAFVAIVAVLGTSILPYATMLYAHVPSAMLLLAAFLLADSERPSSPAWGGVAAGLAILTNYLCAPPVALIALYAAARRPRNALLFIAGTVPPMAVLAWYHVAAFGSIFATSIHRMDRRFVDERAFLGIFRLPSAKVLWGITFSQYRGLFFFSPFLLLAIPAAVRLWRRREGRFAVAIILAIVAFFFLANASFNGWHGGYASGPRYLIPIIPLMALLIVREDFGVAGKTLAAISVGVALLVTAVDAQPSSRLPSPLFDSILPHLMAGEVGVNPRAIEALRSKYPLGSSPAEWASFNLGELLVSGPLSLLPLMVWLVAGGAWIALRIQGMRYSRMDLPIRSTGS